MDLTQYVNTFGSHLKNRFGERVRKLTLSAGFSCPNRDGTLGRGGCSFCNVKSFSGDDQSQSIEQQLAAGRQSLKAGTRKYLAYFQAYTNTYAEVARLKALYDQAIAEADVVGLCVGTRPDCVPDAVLDLLAQYQSQGYEVWLELGLQSAFDETLRGVNRGHGYTEYQDAVARAHQRGLQVCAHLIVGLPGETPEQSLVTLERVLDTGLEGIKLHPLHIVRGSQMAYQYRAGEIPVISQAAYVAVASEMIRRTPREVVYHRVAAEARKPTLIAPEWCEQRWPPIVDIARDLAANGAQGSRC